MTKSDLAANAVKMAAMKAKSNWFDELEGYLFAANLDGALAYIQKTPVNQELKELGEDGDAAKALYARNLVCEVLDYAGLREQASQHIGEAGADARNALEREREGGRTMINLSQLGVLKQQCWCCLQLGMIQHYRRQQWEEASSCFDLAMTILERIARAKPNSCLGSLSRAHYCLGLVAREQHDYTKARQHFSKSIELAGKKLDEERTMELAGKKPEPGRATSSLGQHREGSPPIPVSFLKYSVARAAGLGMAWLAYARGSISEAFAHLVSARQLLPEKGVRYIRAYIDVVQACTLRAAGADNLNEVIDAILALDRSYRKLGGDEFLGKHGKQSALHKAEGHRTYAIRAALELATAYLSAARLSPNNLDNVAPGTKSRSDYLGEALKKVDLVIAVLRKHSTRRPGVSIGRIADLREIESLTRAAEIEDPRTYCNALILGSRILRELGHDHAGESSESKREFYKAALRVAQTAALIAENGGPDLRFSQIDSWIACGDGHFYCAEYSQALEQFDKAAADERARTNPKVVAVCELQRARCHARLGDSTRARDILLKWRGYGQPGSENAYIRSLEAALNQDLDDPEYGVLSLKPGESLRPLNSATLEYWRKEVNHWFAVEAVREVIKENPGMKENKALNAAAEKLDMVPATLKNWRDRKTESKRGRAKNL